MTTPTTATMTGHRRRRRGEIMALAVALGWSAALIVAAAVLPVYSSQSDESSTNAGAAESLTLVAVNGWRVLLTVAGPLVFSAAVAAALRRAHERPPASPRQDDVAVQSVRVACRWT